MRKTGRVLRVISAMLALAVLLTGSAFAEGAYPENGYVRLADGVSMDMLSADFWLSKAAGADKTLMTGDEIRAFNEKHSKLIGDADGSSFSLDSIGETMDGGMLRRLIESLIAKRPEDPSSRYLHGQPTTLEYWDALAANCNTSAILDSACVSFGYSVTRAELRLFPSADFIGEDATDTFYDAALCSEMLPFLPVCKVHESADGEWWYVFMYGMSGWVRKECVALCPSREDWLARQAETDFLVVTGRELRLADEPLVPELSRQLLPMGTRLPLVPAESLSQTVNDRAAYGNYAVKLPVRGADGMIADKLMLIPVSEDVNIGCLPYTHKNVLTLAFKRLGDRYGWGGMFHATDCSGLVHEIYACFGFVLPRTAGSQANLSEMFAVDLTEMTEAEKLSKLSAIPAGTLLYFPGHIMLYLGMDNGVPYVISAAGTLAAHDGQSVENVSAVIVNSLYAKRRNGKTWLESLTRVQTMELEKGE